MSINAQPFSPSFKLVDNLQDGQVLIFDVSENAFVNAYGDGSGANTTPVTSILNLGNGTSLSDGVTGNALELKSLVAGSGITIADETTHIVISAETPDMIQSATSIGEGASVLASIIDNDFNFKSVKAGAGIGVDDDGSTLTIRLAGTVGQGLYLEVSNNLSDLPDAEAARQALDVMSKTEMENKFIRLDGHSVPDMDNTWDIGSAQRRFNDIYAETLQGTAVLANNLTIVGNQGDVLKYDGQRWVAGQDEGSSFSGDYNDLDNIPVGLATQAYVDQQVASVASGGTIDLSGYATDQDVANAVAAINTFSGDYNDLTNKPTLFSGSYNDLTDIPQSEVDLTPYALKTELFSGQYADLTGAPTIPTVPTNISEFTNDSSYATTTYVDTQVGAINTFSGDYNDLTNKPTLFSGDYNDLTNTPTDISQFTDTTGLLNHVNLTGYATELYVDDEISNALSLYATTAYVDGRFTEILGAAPEALDTLKELSDALGGDANFATTVTNQLATKANSADLATVATSGSYTDLTGTPDLTGYATTTDVSNAVSAINTFSGNYNDLTNRPTLFSGDYNDLANTPAIPTVPTNVSAFTNDAGYTTFDGQYSSLTGTPFIPADVSDLTDTTSLLNDYGDANVSTYLGGNVDTHIIPDTDVAYDLGSPTHKFRDIYLSSATIYMDTDALTRDANGNLKWKGQDLQDFNQLKNKPDLSDLPNNGSNRAVKLNDLENFYTKAETNSLLANVSSGGTVDLTGYATETYVQSQGFATQSYVQSQGFLTNSDLTGYAQTGDLAGFLTGSDLNGYATQSYVQSQGFLTNSDLSGYVTQTDLNGYATQTYVNSQGFLKSADLSGYATTSDLNNFATTSQLSQYATTAQLSQYATTAQLSDYATETWALSTFATPSLVNSIIGTKDLSDFSDNNNLIPVDITDLTDTTGVLNPNVFSGSWNDLTDKPTIATDLSQLTDTTGILQGIDTDAQSLTLTGTSLQISGGNSVDLSSLAGTNALSGGTGIDLTNDVISLDANLGDLNNVSSAQPITGQILKWNGTQWAPENGGGADLSQSSIDDLNDVDITGVQTGNFLIWDGTKFTAGAPSAADISNESITELSDVTTDVPNTGDVLTWNGSSYAPSAPAGGGGGASASVEYFKLNYATNGSLASVSNTTSGVSATILSTTGGDVEITFTGYNFPPANVLLYGYAYSSNEYVIMPLNKDITTRKVAGGGSAGSPTAFGDFGSTTMTLKLREADTGSSRSFGTTTHAWIVFSMVN